MQGTRRRNRTVERHTNGHRGTTNPAAIGNFTTSRVGAGVVVIDTTVNAINMLMGRSVTQLRQAVNRRVTAKGVNVLFQPSVRTSAANDRHNERRDNTIRHATSRKMHAVGKYHDADKGANANVNVTRQDADLTATNYDKLDLDHLDNILLLDNLLFNNLADYNFFFNQELHL